MLFKGGTSLSKGYDLIKRASSPTSSIRSMSEICL
ncbi:nucleotidyl transferase AbiEii/AbiGii toxin family protein [Mesorhizobium amorphae]